MGLLDRFKNQDRPSPPDTLTMEALARVRAQPGVVAVEAVDADTIAVTWSAGAAPDPVSLADIRPRWAAASGFERIEVMDDWVTGVGPSTTGLGDVPDEPLPEPVGATAPSNPPIEPLPEPEDAAAVPAASNLERLVVVVGRSGDDGCRWSITPHLDAHLAVDRPDALAVTEHELDEWGLTLDQAREAAITALVRGGLGLDPLGDGLAAFVATRPDHKAGWLTAPQHLLDESGFAAAVVLVPTPTELVIADATDLDTVLALLQSTLTILGSVDDVCWPAPLLVDASGVSHWQPAADHPAASLVTQMLAQA